MGKTAQFEHRGWKISLRCMERAPSVGEPKDERRFTASALASLKSPENNSDWVDPRAQLLSIEGKRFSDEKECLDTLLGETKQLIDGLKK